MQMLLVALSRRMCCSRVCSAIRRAGLPSASLERPMIRPGRKRLWASPVAKKAACGPPKPIGTPNRWLLPMAMSAPNSPGGVSRVRASRSVATVTRAPAAWARSQRARWSRRAPSVAGYWSSAPTTLGPKAKASGSPTVTSMPRASARVWTTAIVCGWQRWSTRYTGRPSCLVTATVRYIASAAAVASSRREALATGRPVRSATTVWKFSSASSRPCAISAW